MSYILLIIYPNLNRKLSEWGFSKIWSQRDCWAHRSKHQYRPWKNAVCTLNMRHCSRKWHTTGIEIMNFIYYNAKAFVWLLCKKTKKVMRKVSTLNESTLKLIHKKFQRYQQWTRAKQRLIKYCSSLLLTELRRFLKMNLWNLS